MSRPARSATVRSSSAVRPGSRPDAGSRFATHRARHQQTGAQCVVQLPGVRGGDAVRHVLARYASCGFVALVLAMERLFDAGKITRPVLRDFIAAVSVGIVGGRALLDLDYSEDSAAEVDMNVVRTGDGRFVEIQGTAETEPFSREQMNQMVEAAELGVDRLIAIQRETIVHTLGQAPGGKGLRVIMDPTSRGKINWKENAL